MKVEVYSVCQYENVYCNQNVFTHSAAGMTTTKLLGIYSSEANLRCSYLITPNPNP